MHLSMIKTILQACWEQYELTLAFMASVLDLEEKIFYWFCLVQGRIFGKKQESVITF